MISLSNSHCYPHFTDVETETEWLRRSVTLSSHTSKGQSVWTPGSLAPKSKLINTKLRPILWWLCGCGSVLNWGNPWLSEPAFTPGLCIRLPVQKLLPPILFLLEGGDKDQISWTQRRWGWDEEGWGWPSLHRIDSFCWSKSSSSHCWQLVVT